MKAFFSRLQERAGCMISSALFPLCCTMTFWAVSPVWSGVIRMDQNPTRWTISTEHSTYQVILATDKNLVSGYFGPLSGERLFELRIITNPGKPAPC